MSPAVTETVPTVWVDARDVPFFRITASLFDPEFVLGATVLLASYDALYAETSSEPIFAR